MPELRDLLEPDVLAGLRAYIEGEQEPETIRKTVNTVLRDWLTREGFIPFQEGPPGEVDPDA